MASILDKYGIKEVADVTFYEIDDDGKRDKPVLFLDTLKVSTIEQTAEETEARGGKGNPPLIIWDYGKEINVTLEDALFSAKSLAVMFGGGKVNSALGDTKITKTIEFTGTAPTVWEGPTGIEYPISDAVTTKADGTEGTPAAGEKGYITFEITPAAVSIIEITPNTFPGTYYVTGDTYARSAITGKDEFFQFIMPKAKVQSENTITLEAEGDPSVFNMSLRLLRDADGGMMKLVQYSVTEPTTEG